MTEKKPHGGVRKGAGRKPKYDKPLVHISARVHPETRAEIKRRAKAAKGSVGQLFDETFNPAARANAKKPRPERKKAKDV